ncbi:WG repeat-containing protein [Fulvivirgaceae bacterium PWU5]|uniref:WG repeat-containing protein n=2 Tax=Dawidia cretensis TaxID=2782350 RepID=A0AAP2DZD6_9BACT|nr:WG repeat-containing protein [Dawidia cretensis]
MVFSCRDAVAASLFLLIGMTTASCSRKLSQQTTAKTIHQLLGLDAGGCQFTSPKPKSSAVSDEQMPAVEQGPVTPDSVLEKILREAKPRFLQPSRYADRFTVPGIVLANGNTLYIENNRYGLKKSDGTVILAPMFDYITPAFTYAAPDSAKGFAACVGTGCNYYDADGKKVLATDYAGVLPTAAGTFIIYTQEGVGIVDAAGRTLVAPSFYDITTLDDSRYRPVIGRDGQGPLVPTAVNVNGETYKSHFFYRVYTHAYRSFLLSGDVSDTLWLPESKYGHELFDVHPHFVSAGHLMIDDMLVNVKTRRKLICEPGYEVRVVNEVRQLASVVAPDGLEYLVHFDGTLVTPQAFYNIAGVDMYEGNEASPNPVSVVSGAMPAPGSGIDPVTLDGAIDRNGQWVIPPEYSVVSIMGPGVLAGYSGGTIDLFDAAGNKLTAFKYTEISPFGDGLLLVAGEGGADVVRASSGEKLQHDLPYSKIEAVDFNGVTYYIAEGPEGETVLNETFTPVLPGFYAAVFETLHNGAIKVLTSYEERSGRYRLYECNGKVRKIKVQGREYDSFSWIASPDAGLTHVVLNDGTAWFVLSDGNSVPGDARIRTMAPANYRNLYITSIAIPEDLGGGETFLRIKYGMVNTEGQTVIPPTFDKIEPFSAETGLAYFLYNEFSDYAGSGYITHGGDVLFDMQYMYPTDLEGGLFRVWKNHRCGVVTRSNKVIVPIVYDEIEHNDSFFLLEAKRGKTIDRYTPQGTKIK